VAKMRNAYTNLAENLKGRKHLENLGVRWEDNIKINFN
jgi:hypothetical protein